VLPLNHGRDGGGILMLPLFPFVAAALAAPLVTGGLVAAGVLGRTVARYNRSGNLSITPHAPIFPEIDGLVELRNRLGFDIAQKTAWHKLELTTWEIVGAEQACKQRCCEDTIAALEQDDVDLNALQIVRDRYFEERRVYSSETVNNWLAFFNELNASQKETARRFFKEKLRQLSNCTANDIRMIRSEHD